MRWFIAVRRLDCVLQCVAMCWFIALRHVDSVLQRIAACCFIALRRLDGVLQSVEVCCSACSQLHDVLQYVQAESWCIAVRASSYVLQCFAVCCRVLQCVAVCCSVWQYAQAAVCCKSRRRSGEGDAAKYSCVVVHALVEKPAMVLVILSSQHGSG